MVTPVRAATRACLALACALAAAQPSQPRVTVLPFEGVGIARGDVQALTLFFETALQNTGGCQIIEQIEVDKVLRAHQYVLADFNDPGKAVAIGKLIPADHIVLGTVGTLSGKYYVNVKMIELRTGANVGARNATAETLDRLSASLTDVARQMMGVSARPGPAQPGLAFREATLSFFESGPGTPPLGQRSYASAFESRSTRFINWEVNLKFATAAAPAAFVVEVRFFRSDGSVLTTQNVEARVEAGWDWYACWNGWGASEPGYWGPGTYTAQALVASRPVTSATFVVR